MAIVIAEPDWRDIYDQHNIAGHPDAPDCESFLKCPQAWMAYLGLDSQSVGENDGYLPLLPEQAHIQRRLQAQEHASATNGYETVHGHPKPEKKAHSFASALDLDDLPIG